MASEPPEWTRERKARMAQQFPELAVASTQQVFRTDLHAVQQNQPPTQLSQTLMRLAAASGKQ